MFQGGLDRRFAPRHDGVFERGDDPPAVPSHPYGEAQRSPCCKQEIVPGGGHNFGNDVPEWREKSRELLIAFLKKQGLVE